MPMLSLLSWLLLAQLTSAPPARSPANGDPAHPPRPGRAVDATVPQVAADEPVPITLGPLRIGGYLQGDAAFGLGEHDHATMEHVTLDSFRVRRARVVVNGDVKGRIDWVLSGDLVQSPILLDAYITFRQVRFAHVRVGQFVAPYSLERLTSESQNEAYERVIDRFVPSRDIGVMVFSAVPLWRGIGYAVAVVNGAGQNVADDNGSKDLVGRVTWTVPGIRGLTLGANAQSGHQPAGPRTRVGADAAFDNGTYRLVGEWLRQTRGPSAEPAGEGCYLLATRRFRPASPQRDFYMAELVGRVFGVRDPADPLLGPPTEFHRDVEVGVNYYFTRSVKLMAHLLAPIDRQPGEPRATFAARAQVSF
jgi:hypothetical protein